MQVLSRFNPIDIEEDGHAVTREHLATGAAVYRRDLGRQHQSRDHDGQNRLRRDRPRRR